MTIIFARLGSTRNSTGAHAQVFLSLFFPVGRRFNFALIKEFEFLSVLLYRNRAEAFGLLDLPVIRQVEQWVQAHRCSS